MTAWRFAPQSAWKAAVTAVLILMLLSLFFFYRSITDSYETVALALFPSVARASHYGALHVDSRHAALYDLREARYFYEKAADLDTTYPYVHHQLARIAFLRGDFNTAFLEINTEIDLHGKEEPNTYYVRGLIEGYMGKYDTAAADYETFLKSEPTNWAALNDYAWVLLKGERYADAVAATERGLAVFPENPWLLNSQAIGLYELGRYKEALVSESAAENSLSTVKTSVWLTAYPGNDPAIASQGVDSFIGSVEGNLKMIQNAVASSTRK